MSGAEMRSIAAARRVIWNDYEFACPPGPHGHPDLLGVRVN
jgi:hypothetical protein